MDKVSRKTVHRIDRSHRHRCHDYRHDRHGLDPSSVLRTLPVCRPNVPGENDSVIIDSIHN